MKTILPPVLRAVGAFALAVSMSHVAPLAALTIPEPLVRLADAGPALGPMLPLADVLVRTGTVIPVVDGSCFTGGSGEYGGDATLLTLPITLTGGSVVNAQLYLKHTATIVWACFNNLPLASGALSPTNQVAIYLHPNASPPATPGAESKRFSIGQTGILSVTRGGFGGAWRAWTEPLGAFTAARFIEDLDGVPIDWSAELRISRTAFNNMSWTVDGKIGHTLENLRSSSDVQGGGIAGFSKTNPASWKTGDFDSSATGSANLIASWLEVTQAVQDPTNSVVLVDGKRTFVRFHVRSASGSVSATARLSGIRGSTRLGALYPINPGGVISVGVAPDRGQINDSFLFELPRAWLSGTVNLLAELNPYHVPEESSYADNNWALPISFAVTDPLRVALHNVQYRSSSGAIVKARRLDERLVLSYLRRAYPISTLDAIVRTTSDLDPNGPFAMNIAGAAGHARNVVASHAVNTGGRRMQVAMVTDLGGFMRGETGWNIDGVWETAGPAGVPVGNFAWDVDGSYADWYTAHELGHALGRPHIGNNIFNNINCGADWQPANGYWPYVDSQIGPLNESRFFGFDAGGYVDELAGASNFLPMRVIPPTATDFMSYCDNQWISDFTTTNLRNSINSRFPAALALARPEAAEAASAAGDFLRLYGTISAAGVAVLDEVKRVPWVPVASTLGSGGYAIRLFDGVNAQLASYTFDAPTGTLESGAIVRGISHNVNYVAGTRRIGIFDFGAGQEIGSMAVSANAPTVFGLTYLPSAPLPASGPVTLTWSSADADGDPLKHEIWYSADNQASWRMLANGITGTTHTLDASELEGTNGGLSAYFRVFAWDGALTGYAEPIKFAVVGKRPEAAVVAPANNARYGYGQSFALEGLGQDFEDGTLPDNRMSWTSNLNGFLGSGRLIHPELLSPGIHTLTLRMTDTHNMTSTASVRVQIDTEVELAGVAANTLAVWPAVTGFLGNWAGTPIPTQTLSIRNLFGTNIPWTAATNADWLALSKTSGSTADRIVMTATNGVVATQPERTAVITITAPLAANSPQVVTVTFELLSGPPLRAYTALVMR